jgi:hypothetical protein
VIAGNIIFPALGAAYVLQIFLPPLFLVALFIEGSVALRLEPDTNWKRVAAAVSGANVWSWVVGIVLTAFEILPTGLVAGERGLTQGPRYAALAVASFPLAWALSTAAEFVVYYPLRRALGFRKPLRVAFQSNTLSYLFIVGVLGLLSILDWSIG